MMPKNALRTLGACLLGLSLWLMGGSEVRANEMLVDEALPIQTEIGDSVAEATVAVEEEVRLSGEEQELLEKLVNDDFIASEQDTEPNSLVETAEQLLLNTIEEVTEVETEPVEPDTTISAETLSETADFSAQEEAVSVQSATIVDVSDNAVTNPLNVIRQNLTTVPDVSLNINPNEILTTSPVVFSVNKQPELTYNLALYRANGALVRKFVNQESFTWIFQNAGRYQVSVEALKDGAVIASATYYDIDVQFIKPEIIDVQYSMDPVYAMVPVSFTAQANVPSIIKQYNYYALRSNGTKVNLGSSTIPSKTWTFFTPDAYSLAIEAVDIHGQTGVLFERALPVQQLSPALNITVEGSEGPETVEELLIYQPANFAVDAPRLFTYNMALYRSNGNLVRRFTNLPSFNWTFYTPGSYKVEVETYLNGERIPVSAVHTVAVKAETPVVDSIRLSCDPVYAGALTNISATVNIPEIIRNYEYYLHRSNGSRVNLYNGASSSFNWRFFSEDDYTLFLVVTDAYGQKSEPYQMNLPVTYYPPELSMLVRSGVGTETLFVNDRISFQAGGIGYSTPFSYNLTLIRENGTRIAMTRNFGAADWRFSTPGNYHVETKVTDILGCESFLLTPFTVELKPLIVSAIGVSRNPVRVYEGVDFAVRYANNYGDTAFEYLLIRENGTTIAMNLGKESSDRINWSFLTPGNYNIQATVRDAAERVNSFTLPISVLENPPRIISLMTSFGQATTPNTPFRITGNVVGGYGQYTYTLTRTNPNNATNPIAFKVINNQLVAENVRFGYEGTYKVSLSVTDQFGDKDEKSIFVFIDKNVHLPILYLSPSNQPGNLYYNGVNTEREQMELLAAMVRDNLRSYAVRVHLPDYEAEDAKGWRKPGPNNVEAIKITGRPTEASNLDADFYLAIHSNATGTGAMGTGPLTLYHPDSALSKEMATSLFNSLMAVNPPGGNTSGGVRNGMNAFNGRGYGEVRSPMMLGIPSVLLEVNFHDNATTGSYIINNKALLAKQITQAIVDTLSLQPLASNSGTGGSGGSSAPTITNFNILAAPTATQAQAVAWAKKKGAASWFIEEIPTFWSYSIAAGVDPAITFAQAALETGHGNYPGVLTADYKNTCGLKTPTGGGDYEPEAHAVFATWDAGISAHVDHLALYAGQTGYPKARQESYANPISIVPGYTTDPRHFPFLFGKAKTVQELNGKWASSPIYSETLMRLITELRSTR